MKLIYEDRKKRVIKGQEEIKFSSSSGLHLIILTGRAKSEKQISKSSTDDEELTLEIDGKIFPKLSFDSKNVLDSPASINGGKSHNLLKTVYFLTNLSGKDHKIILKTDNPPNTATFESLEVYSLEITDTLTLEPKLQVEDGDRREWVTFVLDNLPLNSLTVSFNLKRRFIDSDDVKVIVDGVIKRNDRSILHKLWYFIASIFTGETQTETFNVNLLAGLHYIEFWADRMPTLNKISFQGLKGEAKLSQEEIIKEKIRTEAEKVGLDPQLMLSVAAWESHFDPEAVSPVGAKGIFQLTAITIKDIEQRFNFKIVDPFDVDQNIKGAMLYFKWLMERYNGDSEQVEKTLVAWNWGLNNFPKDPPLDWDKVPDATKAFVRNVLNR